MRQFRCGEKRKSSGSSSPRSARSSGAFLAEQIRSNFTSKEFVAWFKSVCDIFLKSYGGDRSGSLDTPSEARAIPCQVWCMIGSELRREHPSSTVLAVSGIRPSNSDVGYTLGLFIKHTGDRL